MKKILAILSILASAACFAKVEFAKFENPPMDTKPWFYWIWFNGNVDKQSITDDLENIKRIGGSGVLFFDNRGYWEDERHLIYPKPLCEHMSGLWLENLTHAVMECKRLGLKISINLSSCGGNLKGAWPAEADAPKRLVFKSIPADKGFSGALPRPESKYNWPIATLAVKYEGEKIAEETQWLSGGDGTFTMSASSGKLTDKINTSKRKALEVVDLTRSIKGGKLDWAAPDAGNWLILQISYEVIGGREYDVDILDANAVARHYERFVGEFRKRFGGEFGKTVAYFYNVSWEGSVPTWTHKFEEFFKADRSYDIKKYLPYLCGLEVGAPEDCERFMTDFRRARNNCFREHFYAKMGELAHADGVKWHSESGGPWVRKPQVFGEADQLAFLGLNDMPQGEFWEATNFERKVGRFLVLPIASAANIYGKKYVAQESFTYMMYHWSMYPSMLKWFGDFSFVQGVNFSFLHTFPSSGKKYGKPGLAYFAGTHFNANNTWFEQSAGFMKYIARCQYLLRHGKPRQDFCLYQGDMPYQHWYWTNRKAGEPIQDFNPFKYDLINNDILLNRAKVVGGKLCLESGMVYKALLIDLNRGTVSPKALAKILEFKQAGLPVFAEGAKPKTAAGLAEDRAAAAPLADKLWDGKSFGDFLKSQKPACEGAFAHIARRGENDVYFLSGEGESTMLFDSRGVPELWDAVSGKRYAPDSWRKTDDGRIAIDIALPKHGSIFVVFNEASDAAKKEPELKNSLAIGGEWSVEFPAGSGAPEKIKMQNLADLSKHSDFGVRHFAGTASYKNAFDIKKIPARATLVLPEVNYVAEVFINGKKAATLWTYPFECDVSRLLKEGKNSVEIKVATLWRNRLIGDCYLPPDKKIAKTNVRTRNRKRTNETLYSGYCQGDPLAPAGLAGEVILKY